MAARDVHFCHSMPPTAAVDVSVVVPFADHEDVIGTACGRVARHLGELGLSFEILAVDEASGDNSHAVLGLLRRSMPALRIVAGARAGRGFAMGSACARGRVLWLLEPHSALRSLAPFGRGELDLAVVRGRFAVVKRARALGLVDAVHGMSGSFERRLVKRATGQRLVVEAYEVGGSTSRPGPGLADRVRLRLAWALGAVAQRP
jgi:dolichol-phosphate mannosyltransferase